MTEELDTVVSTSLWTHLITVGGVLLAIFAIARLFGERREPGNTFAWLLAMIVIPWLAIPLFLLFGGRKLARVVARKRRVIPSIPQHYKSSEKTQNHPVAHTIRTNGGVEPIGFSRVKLITSGEQAFEELCRQIGQARQCIDITTFILSKDETGISIIHLLAKRARDGIRVRLLIDALGCFFLKENTLKPLRDAGGQIVRFMPMLPLGPRGSANLRNHRKIAVFDQQVAIIGGHNLAMEYMGANAMAKRWADLGAMITGPAVGQIHEIFLADWHFAKNSNDEDVSSPSAIDSRALEEGDAELQIVASGPDVPGDPLYEGIISMVQEAQRNIWIVTPYFIPDEVLLRNLVVKARAGRDVTLILPEKSNHPITDFARRTYLRELHKAGARILAYQPGMLHSKAVIVDDKVGLIGSANFDMRSLFVNFEIGVFIYSEQEVAALRTWAGNLVRHCEEMTCGPTGRRSLSNRLIEDVCRLFAPML